MRRKLYKVKRTLQRLPQGYSHRKKEYHQLIFLHTQDFYRTLNEVVCRSLLYNTHRNSLRTLSNTTASERFENRSSPGLCNVNIYMRRVFAQENIAKYILLSPASAVYALFVLNTKESKNQYRESHYGSTFEAVLYLQHNRPPSKFNQ